MDCLGENAAYKVDFNDKFGRFLVAGKDLKEGEIILKETPALIGSTIKAVLVCFKCMRHLRTNFQMCSGCNVAVLCSKSCSGNFHSEDECTSLKASKITAKNVIENPQLVLPLRCLLLRDYNPQKWETFSKLEPHLASRKDTSIWRSHEINVERILHELQIISEDDMSRNVVQRICGILDVNSFEARPREFNGPTDANIGVCLRAVYLEAALMAHDCVANTHVAIDDEFNIVVRASRCVPKGGTIFFNYSNVLTGNCERQAHLKGGKYFDCICRRCVDSTELGSEVSSLKCNRCREGIIRKSGCGWECCDCRHVYSESLIGCTVNEAKRLMELTEFTNVVDPEQLLTKLLLTFHENHYLILELEQNLIPLYTQSTPNVPNLDRKIKLCRHLLSVIRKLEPGISRSEAITLYELQNALTSLANLQYANHTITDENYVANLLSAEEILKMALKLLLYEPANSPEGRLARVALKELKELRSAIRRVEDVCGRKMTSKVERELRGKMGVKANGVVKKG